MMVLAFPGLCMHVIGFRRSFRAGVGEISPLPARKTLAPPGSVGEYPTAI